MISLIKKCLKKIVKSNTDIQTAQIEMFAGEVVTTQQLEPYGMTSTPPADVGVGVVAVYDDRHQDKSVLLGWFDGLFRPKGLTPGEVCFYSQFGQKIKFDKDGKTTISDQSGSSIVLNNNKTITINADALNVNAQNATFSGNITAVGSIISSGAITATGAISGSVLAISGNSISDHTHTQSNGAQTSAMNNPLP
jgi:phage baseplate assembly protein V